MRYVRAIGAGWLAAAATAGLYLAASALYLELVLVPRAQANATFGSWDATYPQSFDLRGPMLVGFVVGFWWMRRRQRGAGPTLKIRS